MHPSSHGSEWRVPGRNAVFLGTSLRCSSGIAPAYTSANVDYFLLSVCACRPTCIHPDGPWPGHLGVLPKVTLHFLRWKFSAASFQVTVAVESAGNTILSKGIK